MNVLVYLKRYGCVWWVVCVVTKTICEGDYSPIGGLVSTVYYSSVAFIKVTKLICVDRCSEQAAENNVKKESGDGDVGVATKKVNLHPNYNVEGCNKLA